MPNRITQKDLEFLVKRINEKTGSPPKPYTNPGPDWIACIGNYHLDYAYGGVKLVRMISDGGGIEEISTGGYGTKRELYQWLRAFLIGLGAKSEV